MTLREIARECRDEIIDGIAWVAVWKTGRSWNAYAFYLDDEDMIGADELDVAREAFAQDPGAVLLNGYYCGHFGEGMVLADIAAAIRYHYENGYNLLENNAAYTEAVERAERREEAAKADDTENDTENDTEEVITTRYGKLKAERRLTAGALAELCKRKGWYTRGNTEEYRHLLCDMAEDKGNITVPDIVEIAQDIIDHSNIVSSCLAQDFLCRVCMEVAQETSMYFWEAEDGNTDFESDEYEKAG